MTERRLRAASLGIAGALAAGLVIVPSIGATATGAGGSTDAGFSAVSANQVAPAADRPRASTSSSTLRAIRSARAQRAASSNPTQILQIATGIQGVGSNGVAVATGPKQVVQATGLRIRALTKSTLVRPKGGDKSLLSFFGLSSPVSVTQPAVIYDPVGKRFIASAIKNDAGDIGLVMRISKGTDAAPLGGSKWLKPVEFASATSPLEEPTRRDVNESKPLIGVSSDKIGITVVADDPNDAAVANRIFIFPKAKYYNGKEPGGWAASVDNTYDGQAPAVNATKQANLFIAIPDTGDVTVATYTGAATSSPPKFSKNVVFPTTPLVAPPLVTQTGGDDLDLGGLAFTGVAWRKNSLYAATTVNSGGRAAIRVFGINTGSGVSLASDKKLASITADWFNPDLAIDGAGNVLLTANDEGRDDGPSLAVFARKSSDGKWTPPRFIALATDVVTLPGNPVTFENTTGAALDPTSPRDVWVSGVVGASGVPNSLSTKIARVSIAKNRATIKASSTKVKKGTKVTFTLKLARPGSKDTIKGLPVALQRAPKSGGSWSTVKSGKTAANGTAKFKISIKKAAKYRTLGKAVKQSGGAGRAVAQVTSRAITVNLK